MDRIRPLRTFTALLFFTALPSVLVAQDTSDDTVFEGIAAIELGRSTTETVAGFVPLSTPKTTYHKTASNFMDRNVPNPVKYESTSFSLGDVTLFAGETSLNGEYAVRFGTSLAHGRATTGISLTYSGEKTIGEPEVFVDYVVTNSLQVGLSGGLTEITSSDGEQVGRFGLTAAFDVGNNALVQGEISDTLYTSPEIGLALGLKF